MTEREMEAGLADMVEVRDVFWNIGREAKTSSLHPADAKLSRLAGEITQHLDKLITRGGGLMPGVKRVTTFCVKVEVDRAKRWEAVSRYLGHRTVGAWLATLAAEKVRETGKLVPREPLNWRRARFRVTLNDFRTHPATVERQVSGYVAGVFGIYRGGHDVSLVGRPGRFTLVHVPTGRQLCTLPYVRECKSVARQLAALRKMGWNETDPEKVAGDDGPSARAIIEQARRVSGEPHPLL